MEQRAKTAEQRPRTEQRPKTSVRSSYPEVSSTIERLAVPRSLSTSLLCVNKKLEHELKANIDKFERTASNNVLRISTALSTESRIRERRWQSAKDRRSKDPRVRKSGPTAAELFNLGTNEMARLTKLTQKRLRKRFEQPEWDGDFLLDKSLSLPMLRPTFKSKSEINYERSMARYMFRQAKGENVPATSLEDRDIIALSSDSVELSDTDVRPSFAPSLGVLTAAYLRDGVLDSPRRRNAKSSDSNIANFSRYSRSSNAKEMEAAIIKQQHDMVHEVAEENRRTSYYRKKDEKSEEEGFRQSQAGEAMREVTTMSLTKMASKCRTAWDSIVKELRLAGERIDYGHITEIGSYENPPETVMKVIGYIGIILGMTPTWPVMKIHLFKDHCILQRFFRNVQPLTIPVAQIEKAHKYREENLALFNPAAIKSISSALLPFAKWIEVFNLLGKAMVAVQNLRYDRKRSGIQEPEVVIEPPPVRVRVKPSYAKTPKNKPYGSAVKLHPIEVMSSTYSSKKQLFEESEDAEEIEEFTQKQMEIVKFEIRFFEDLATDQTCVSFWGKVQQIIHEEEVAEFAALEREEEKEQMAAAAKESQQPSELPEVNARNLRLAAESCLRSMIFPDQQPRRRSSISRPSSTRGSTTSMKSKDGIISLSALGKTHMSLRSFKGVKMPSDVAGSGEGKGESKGKRKHARKRRTSTKGSLHRSIHSAEHTPENSAKVIEATNTDDSDTDADKDNNRKSEKQDSRSKILYSLKEKSSADGSEWDTANNSYSSSLAPSQMPSEVPTRMNSQNGILDTDATEALTEDKLKKAEEESHRNYASLEPACERPIEVPEPEREADLELSSMWATHSDGKTAEAPFTGYQIIQHTLPASSTELLVLDDTSHTDASQVVDKAQDITDHVARLEISSPEGRLIDAVKDGEAPPLISEMQNASAGILKSSKDVADIILSTSKKTLSFQQDPEDVRVSIKEVQTFAPTIQDYNLSTTAYLQSQNEVYMSHGAYVNTLAVGGDFLAGYSASLTEPDYESSLDLTEHETIQVGEKRAAKQTWI